MTRKDLILDVWRNVREAHHEAVHQYFGVGDIGNAILMLELSKRRTDILIAVLQKEEAEKKGKG